MIHRRVFLPVILAVALGVASCGDSGDGGSPPAATTPSTSAPTTTTASDPRQQLGDAVRDAIEHDHRQAVRSLWTNRVPTEPVATAGPALAQWRRSTAVARRRGIRVRVLSERFRTVSVRLEPSFDRAVAVVADDQRVQPTNRRGRPLGKSVLLHERARLELRRVRGTDRFVVWRVEGVPRR